MINEIKLLCVAAAVCSIGAAFAEVPMFTLTFDDNPKGHLTIAAPVLEKYGYRGAFNVITDTVGKNELKLTWEDIKELRRRGHEIVSHTKSHPSLVKLLARKGADAVMHELTASRDAILRETGAAPRFLCHPYCASNPAVDALVRSAGMIPMGTARHNFGKGTTPEKFAAFLDRQIAGKVRATDILFHGITKETGGWQPLASRADFEGCIAELAAREKKGLLRVVDYGTFAGRAR